MILSLTQYLSTFFSNSLALPSGSSLPPNCKFTTEAPSIASSSKNDHKGHVFSLCFLLIGVIVSPSASQQAFPWLELHHMTISIFITGKMINCLKLTHIYPLMEERVVSWYFNKMMLLCVHGSSGGGGQQCISQVPWK